MANFLVVAFKHGDGVNDVSLQCLAQARALADQSGGQVACAVLGSGVSAAASTLFGYGADTVLVADDASLEAFLTAPYKAVLKARLEANPCDAVLLPANTSGDDLAPVLAAELNAACVVGGDSVTLADGRVVVKRMAFDRKVMTSFAAKDGVIIASLRDGVAEVGEPDVGRSGETVALDIPDAAKSPVASVSNRDVAAQTVNLKDARIVVGAGAGIGSPENFQKIRDLATALNAEIGATRAVVDAGWLPADHQIGQTGAVIRPDVYIACGISGAVQHWVGISEAKKIVCINQDKNAPLMKRAHYRVAGDLNEVVPKLVKLLGS